jgi:hypothetical protein
MELKMFGLSCRLEVIIICFIIGFILGGHLLCSCSKIGLQEGMTMMGTSLNWNNSEGQNGSWTSKGNEYAKNMGYSESKTKYSQYKGTPVPLAEGEMLMFKNNEFKPECCPSTYSSSSGCACISQEQVSYINERGGNRTIGPAEY